jgi:carbon-monoxide dehydrogenase medium subunit
MKSRNFEYLRPATLEQALAAISTGGDEVKLLAGGQSLGPMMNLRVMAPKLLVDISRLSELGAVDAGQSTLRIGAAVRHADIEDSALPGVEMDLLRHTASGIAYRAVRNRGTIGGSLAHADPAGDWLPVLMALDARIAARGQGRQREIGAGELCEGALTTVLAPSEMIVAVDLPRLSLSARWGHRKFNRKIGEFADAIAVVVIDRAVDLCRVTLARAGEPPRYLMATAVALAAGSAANGAIGNDLENIGLRQSDDPYLFQLCAVCVERAIGDAMRA